MTRASQSGVTASPLRGRSDIPRVPPELLRDRYSCTSAAPPGGRSHQRFTRRNFDAVHPPVKFRHFFQKVIVNAMPAGPRRSEEHTSELQSLMRISYAVFCLKKKNYSKRL